MSDPSIVTNIAADGRATVTLNRPDVHNAFDDELIARLAGDESFKFLTYQLPTVGYWPTVALTGNGELGFDSGEGA